MKPFVRRFYALGLTLASLRLSYPFLVSNGRIAVDEKREEEKRFIFIPYTIHSIERDLWLQLAIYL